MDIIIFLLFCATNSSQSQVACLLIKISVMLTPTHLSNEQSNWKSPSFCNDAARMVSQNFNFLKFFSRIGW